MSEQETKNVNEMDAAEMLEGFCKENPTGKARRVKTTEDWAWEMIREFEADEKRRNRLQGREALGLCMLAGLTVAACCAAILHGCWKPIVMGIAAANLMMAGGWWQKAKECWRG